jgi:hypothetical protein
MTGPGIETMREISIPTEIEVFAVKHLPVIGAYAEQLGAVKLLNDCVESQMDVEPRIMFLGMILDTLSGRSPLYRLEEFFAHQDTELLLGKPIEAKGFNDDNVGRFLDKALSIVFLIFIITVEFTRLSHRFLFPQNCFPSLVQPCWVAILLLPMRDE